MNFLPAKHGLNCCPKKLTRFLLAWLAAFCVYSLPACAADPSSKATPDMLVFINGDKLAGHLDHEADGIVFFDSDNAGTVQVPWAKLKSLKTSKPFAVIQNGTSVKRKNPNLNVPVGTLELHGDTLSVATLQGVQEIPVKNVQYLVDKATFDHTVLGPQRLLEGITGSLSAGDSTVNSTQNSQSVNTGVTLARGVPAVTWMPPRDRTLLNFSNTYGRISQPNTPTVKTNILHGGLEEDEYFNPRFYFLEQVMYDHNFSQGLDLQQIYGAGFGYTVFKHPKQELDLTATLDYTKQQFTSTGAGTAAPAPGATNNLIGSSIGNTYFYKFPRKILFNETATITPQWNALQDYSAAVTAGATFPIFKNFGLSAQVIDSYLNDPAPGFNGNSLQFNTGLTYTIQ